MVASSPDVRVGAGIFTAANDRVRRSVVHSVGRALRPTAQTLGLGSNTVGRKARPTSAFTLLEILLAVALIALLSAALVSTAVHLTDTKPRSNDQVFWEAVRLARRSALQLQSDVTLKFDDKTKEFVMVGGGAQQSLPLATSAKDLTVEFLQADAANSAILVGGQLVETRTMPAVTFYGDGTCVPFRVQFRANGSAHVIAIDPWTCAPVLIQKDAT